MLTHLQVQQHKYFKCNIYVVVPARESFDVFHMIEWSMLRRQNGARVPWTFVCIIYSATEHQLSNSKTANIINYFLFMHYQKWLCNMIWSMLHIPNILPLSIRHAALVVTAILRGSCFSTYLPRGFSSHLALAIEYSICFLFRV